ncbi:MAG: AAA family ATPase, partial [Succinivibrionaceae bacterium]
SRQERWFRDTAIYKDQEFYSNYMGKFPVVFISLNSVGGSEFARAYYQLACAVFNLYSTFSYLSASTNFSYAEKNTFKEIASDKNFICNINNKHKVTDSLSNLLQFLYKHHGIMPILLIDEHDVPIAKAVENNYYREL